ncbi:hypothetical protein J6A31_05765 [bacterium]|nr:hypothetical protein [bacterium]
MFHCGDTVIVTNFDNYADAQSLMDKTFTVVGIHPVNMHGNYCKNPDEIQFICIDDDDKIIFLMGNTLEKTGHFDYNTRIFDRTYDLSKLEEILNSPKNKVEEYIFPRCMREIKTAVERLGTTEHVRAKIKNDSHEWGYDYATYRHNGKNMKPSISVHVWQSN